MAPNIQYYLTDKVINDYFTLIQKQNPSVYSFDTFFYVRYNQSGYDSVLDLTKKVDLFSYKKVFFPINIRYDNFAHWILVVADIEHQLVIYYDSIEGRYNFEIQSKILKYLMSEHQQKLGKPLPKEDWKIVIGNNPCQSNGEDCGVFVCTIAEYLSRDKGFNFSQKNMTSFRNMIAYELSTQQLFKINADKNAINEEINRITNNFSI